MTDSTGRQLDIQTIALQPRDMLDSLMPFIDPADLHFDVPHGARLMGIDLGTKTIGIALSDTLLTVANPLETIRRVKFTPDAQALLALVDKHQVTGLVLGLPINMDGSNGPKVQTTRQFGFNLMKLRDLPIALWDERLSTAAVNRMLIEADTSRARRAEVVDKLAAAYILQGFLDARQDRLRFYNS